MLGPALFGLWAALSLVRQYLAYSDLGFTNGLGRVLPRVLREHGDDEARRAMGSAWTVAMTATVLFVVAGLIAEWPRLTSGQGLLAWGVVTVAVLTILEKQQMYSSVVFSSMRRVGESGLYMGFLGATELALCLLLVHWFGLYGLYAGLVTALGLTVWVMAGRQPLRARLDPNPPRLRELTAASLALMGYGLTNVALHNVDRVAITATLGAGDELARYHLATVISLVVNPLPYVVLSVLIPQMYQFGGDRPRQLKPYLLLPTAMMSTLAVGTASLVFVVVPPVLTLYLPAFQTDSDLLAALLLAEVGFSIAMVAANLMVALDRNIRGLVVRIVVVGAGFVGSLAALESGGSLVTVAWVMVCVQWTALLVLGGMAASGLAIGYRRFLSVTLLPVMWGLAAQVLLRALLGPESASTLGIVARASLCAALLAPLALIPCAYRGLGPLASRQARAFFSWPAEA